MRQEVTNEAMEKTTPKGAMVAAKGLREHELSYPYPRGVQDLAHRARTPANHQSLSSRVSLYVEQMSFTYFSYLSSSSSSTGALNLNLLLVRDMAVGSVSARSCELGSRYRSRNFTQGVDLSLVHKWDAMPAG